MEKMYTGFGSKVALFKKKGNTKGDSLMSEFCGEVPRDGRLAKAAWSKVERLKDEAAEWDEGVTLQTSPVQPPPIRRSDVTRSLESKLVDLRVSAASLDDDYDLPSISGSCLDMCPASERATRERLHDISVFERVPGGASRYMTSKDLAVKKFSRTMDTSSPSLASEIRPLPVLQKAMDRLLHLLDDPDHSFLTIYDFFSDRSRAVRQEVSMQRIEGREAIEIYKPIVRFHIMASYELSGPRSNGSYDPILNAQQLSKSLTSLLHLFNVEHAKGRRGEEGEAAAEEAEEEGEFFGYFLLLNLGEPDSLSHWLSHVRPSVLKTNNMKFARTALRLSRMDIYCGFCRQLAGASFLQACLMYPHLSQVRETALAAITGGGYKMHPYPLQDLVPLLYFQSVSEVEAVCLHYGLSVSSEWGDAPSLNAKDRPMKKGAKTIAIERSSLVDAKRCTTRLLDVLRGPCVQEAS